MGAYHSQKSMANNKIQGELQLTKTELSTSKHDCMLKHSHMSEKNIKIQWYWHSQKQVSLSLSERTSWFLYYSSSEKRALSISNSMKLCVNLISSPKWTISGVGVWSKLMKTNSGLQLGIYMNISAYTSDRYFSGWSAIFYNLHYWFSCWLKNS